MVTLGYIFFGISFILFGWCLTVWWAFNKYLAIGIPVSIILVLIFAALK